MSVELLDVMNDILDAINGLPYRIGRFMRDDNFHKECPSCGKHVSRLQGARFCPYCGDQVFSAEEVNVNLKVCLGCEMNPEGDSLFNFYFSHCPWCGKELIVLPDDIYIDVMSTIYEMTDGPSSLEDGLSLYELPSKDLVERIEGLNDKRR